MDTMADGSLARMRLAIGGIDHALVLLLGARARLAVRAGRCKVRAGRPLADPEREARVHRRVEAVARRIGLPASTADGLAALAIADARRAQGIDPDPDPAAHAPPIGSRHAMHIPHLPPRPPPRSCASCLRPGAGRRCCARCRPGCSSACSSAPWPRCWPRRSPMAASTSWRDAGWAST
ncbi:chorismate mutase [Luteimonas granuli]|uniref:chorismate mutase n=1 Tax=Luteimonas granuli TaxID=1176533 RepID=A0A518N3E9_9GAMM|nr:chorismate mutase [Luteimonas granuli]